LRQKKALKQKYQNITTKLVFSIAVHSSTAAAILFRRLHWKTQPHET